MPRWLLALLLFSIIALGTRYAWADQTSGARIQLPSVTSVGVQNSKAGATASASNRNDATKNDPLHVRLPVRSKSPSRANDIAGKRRTPSSLFTVISSLALVVGVFLLLAWLTRRAAPRASQSLPPDTVQVLGRVPLAARNMMHLVRIGNKLLLVSLTSQGATTLTEITDPQEVERLSARCERSRPGSISSTFRNVLQQFGEERTASSFLGEGEQRGG